MNIAEIKARAEAPLIPNDKYRGYCGGLEITIDEFIQHAREDIPALIAEVEDLRFKMKSAAEVLEALAEVLRKEPK